MSRTSNFGKEALKVIFDDSIVFGLMFLVWIHIKFVEFGNRSQKLWTKLRNSAELKQTAPSTGRWIWNGPCDEPLGKQWALGLAQLRRRTRRAVGETTGRLMSRRWDSGNGRTNGPSRRRRAVGRVVAFTVTRPRDNGWPNGPSFLQRVVERAVGPSDRFLIEGYFRLFHPFDLKLRRFGHVLTHLINSQVYFLISWTLGIKRGSKGEDFEEGNWGFLELITWVSVLIIILVNPHDFIPFCIWISRNWG